MPLRMLRVWVAAVLGASGALMIAASRQRWACSGVEACERRQDHLFDFLPPAEPWEQAGSAALLGGVSLLVLAIALPLLPWALTGRRPGLVSAIGLLASEPALVAVAVATLRSGLSGAVVAPTLGAWSVAIWMVGPPVLLARFAVGARGWARASAVLLILATPLVAAVTYAIGEYDARPWWEATSGSITVAAALCLLVAAAWQAPRSLEPDAAPLRADVGSTTQPR